jgi:pimeloyl-ACP methyl ester carboxylesterase
VPAKKVDRAWLLLHGTPLDPDVWGEVAPILSDRQPVFIPSAAPMAADHQPQAAVAARFISEMAAVADRWDVVGHSFGGQVAIELALLAPEKVASLSVICSRDTPFPPFALAAANLRAGSPTDIEAALQRWFRPEELRAGGWLVAYARDRLTNADRDSWATALDGIATYDRSDRVHLIHAPATLICAESDLVSDVAAMTALKARLPNAQLHVRPGARHFSPFLQPASLAALLPDPAG